MINTKQDLADYCLRRLGAPVIEVNVTDEQVFERIDDALNYFSEYHFDGTERIYLKAQIVASKLTLATPDASSFVSRETVTGSTSNATADVYSNASGSLLEVRAVKGTFQDGETITGSLSGFTAQLAATNAFVLGNWDKGYVELPDAITSVVRVFPFGATTGSSVDRNIFNPLFQYRLSDTAALLASDLVYYTQVKQHLSMLDMLLPGERTIDFNRKTSKLYIECNWQETFMPGDFVVADCFSIVDPEEYTKIYDDLFVKKYATALIKRQMGVNLSKFTGVKLPGGVELNGQKILEEAEAEILKLEDEMQLRWETPPQPFWG